MAKSPARKFVKIFFIVINFLVVILFLLGCLSPWLNPEKFGWIGFIGIAMPYLILLLIFSIIFWLVAKPKLALIPVITLLLGWQQINAVFAFKWKAGFTKSKTANTIRIVNWNVGGFNGLSKNSTIKKHAREDVADVILNLKPDIICMQEFNSAYHQSMQWDNISLFNKQYPYYYFSKDYHRNNGIYQSGCIIFSKYPLIDSNRIKFKTPESLIYVDAVKGDDTFRIYTTHLQSFKFKKEDYDDIEKIKEQDEDVLAASKNIFSKMKTAFQRRGGQVNIVRNETDKSPYPSVICGDFNDVPNSYTYFHIKGNRQDAFLKKDFGIGRSFIALAPTLRIDYVLPDQHFDVLQFNMVDEDLSDHLLLVTDLRIKK
jgi:endonuclease/exonuclease/phosphatase family metal-dependent hydrolase